ncbi:DUF2911 domain-containing protein [Persicitalea jodogahamensis]|uniref:DUF2911 domain-containing protein n=1 Tax=Persicitalea jodogahamensis TaxID=402147 RepID=A0A8J3D5L3_9BACT|nr:DUF2911 domain-containing protein [Persicitalea jodogahamensis]GHB53733.1 hypothetical protein GCM10007390_03240 [Persicitalea jodogahamensis]
MKKKVLLLSTALLVILLAAAFIGYRSYTKSFSPEAVAEFNQNGLDIRVQYCRPAKKRRLIFGRESDNALVPYDKVWRTGANEATLITFANDVTVAETPVPSGTYSLWTVPGPAKWQLVINRETGQWGTQYNDGMDLTRIEIPIRINPRVTENFKIFFEQKPYGADLILNWDQTEAIAAIRSE